MNIQTYQTCITTLENQIKSRQQQRQGMQVTINEIDHHLGGEINKNKNLREQILYLAQTNQDIINELHHLQQLIREKDHIIENRLAADERRALYIQALEKDKAILTEQIQQIIYVSSQKDTQIIDLNQQLNNALQSVTGYLNTLQQKNIEFAQLSAEFNTSQQKNTQISQKLVDTQNQHQIQRQQLLHKITQSQSSANTISTDLQQKVNNLQKQLQDSKEFYTDQVSTLQFNKESQVSQLLNQISALESKISSLITQISNLKEEQEKVKEYYEVQIENNDKVVNTLINEINFLKYEKIELKKQVSNRIQETVQQILMMGLEMADKQAKVKAVQNEIKSLKEEITRKQKQVSNLNKQIQKLNFQIEITSKQHSGEKDTVLRKNEQIAQLKRFIDNLKKFAQVSDKEKQTITKKTSKQIDSLRTQNLKLSKKLQTALPELQQLRIRSVELQESVRFLSLLKSSTSTSLSDLQSLVKAHQYTIQKLQHMLEQTKKVVIDLNKLMKTKLGEIYSLQMSNLMFRREKVQWIKKEDQYRKRISEYKAASSVVKRNALNESSFMSKVRRSFNEKEKSQQFSRNHSMIVPNSIDSQPPFSPSNSVNGMRRKTMAGNWTSRLSSFGSEDNNFAGSDYQSGNESIQGVSQIPHAQNAFKKPEILRIKKKSADLTDNIVETPMIPVLIAMKKEEEEKNNSFDEEEQNSLEKDASNQQKKICQEGIKTNVIQELVENAQSQPQANIQNTDQNSISTPLQTASQIQQQAQSQNLVQIHVKEPPQVYEENAKQVSIETHPQTPGTKQNLQTIVQARSLNLTPQFHVQQQSQNSINNKSRSQNSQNNKSRSQNSQNNKSIPQDSPNKSQSQNSPKQQIHQENHQPHEQLNLAQDFQTLEEYEEYEEQQKQFQIPKKISPINSRILMKQDQLVEILEDDELTELTEQNELSDLNDLKQTDVPLSHHEEDHDDSVEAQNTVDGISLLLDRINTQ